MACLKLRWTAMKKSRDHPTSSVHGGVVRVADRTKEGVDGSDTCRLTLLGDESRNMLSCCGHTCTKVMHPLTRAGALLVLRYCRTEGGMLRGSCEGAHTMMPGYKAQRCSTKLGVQSRPYCDTENLCAQTVLCRRGANSNTSCRHLAAVADDEGNQEDWRPVNQAHHKPAHASWS